LKESRKQISGEESSYYTGDSQSEDDDSSSQISSSVASESSMQESSVVYSEIKPQNQPNNNNVYDYRPQEEDANLAPSDTENSVLNSQYLEGDDVQASQSHRPTNSFAEDFLSGTPGRSEDYNSSSSSSVVSSSPEQSSYLLSSEKKP
jgi:hypothetical protein